MGLLIAAGALILGYGAAYLGSADVRYLTRAGFEEIRILEHRQPIDRIIADPDTDPETRALLHLVLEVRQHAQDLGLEAGKTYTKYTDVGRDTLLLVLSASRRDCICPVTWKYPIVGRVPYKGFFDVDGAERAANKLAGQGNDVYLRPAGAFSTLGWFEDPLLSTALVHDSVELAGTVFHEIAHNTLYLKSATAFNESFAQLVGYRSARGVLPGAGDSALADRARDRWYDEIVLGEYYRDLVGRLEAFYATRPAGRFARRGPPGHRAVGSRTARRALRPAAPHLPDHPARRAAHQQRGAGRGPDLPDPPDWFDRWYEMHDRSVKASVAAMRELHGGRQRRLGVRPAGSGLRDYSPGSGRDIPRIPVSLMLLYSLFRFDSSCYSPLMNQDSAD